LFGHFLRVSVPTYKRAYNTATAGGDRGVRILHSRRYNCCSPTILSHQKAFNMTIFVPISKDGSRFDPKTCRRDGGYRVGEKGDEQKFASFDDALAALAKMAKPRWRRPNAVGNWGLVTGTRWERA
jgi:hypothetical protein